MSHKLPDMLENTIAKIREMVDVNSVVGQPINLPDGVSIIPVSKVSVGFGGAGSDFVAKNNDHRTENPFGGGVAAGVNVTPIGFLIVKEGNVRMVPVAVAPNTTADRLVEMIPDTIDKVVSFIDSKTEKKAE